MEIKQGAALPCSLLFQFVRRTSSKKRPPIGGRLARSGSNVLLADLVPIGGRPSSGYREGKLELCAR